MYSLSLSQVLAMASGTPHAAPAFRLSVGAAHQVMRDHIECRARRCPRKAAAFDTLIEERLHHTGPGQVRHLSRDATPLVRRV